MKQMRIHNTRQNILEAVWLVGNSYYFHILCIDDDIEALLQEQPDNRQQPDRIISTVFHLLSLSQPLSALITPSFFPYLIFT